MRFKPSGVNYTELSQHNSLFFYYGMILAIFCTVFLFFAQELRRTSMKRAKRVLVVGIDGCVRKLVEQHIAEGICQNFKKVF